MHTTITVNGADGMAFLSSLSITSTGGTGGTGGTGRPIPRALEWLIQSDDPSIDVDLEDAEEVAEFIDLILEGQASGWTGRCVPAPLLFSPRIGDEISIVRDTLLQIQTARRAPRTWRFIARGTRGRLIARHDEVGRVVLLDGPAAPHVTFVRDHAMTKARRSATVRR